MKTNNYICCMPYLRNSIAYDNDFWYTCVKWWFLQVFFSFFWNFHVSGKLEGKRAKNSPKWNKAMTFVMHHISGNSIAYHPDFCYTCVKWWYLQVFFSFLQNFDFSGFWVVNRQKLVQNDKKFCLLCSISQEPYIIWL